MREVLREGESFNDDEITEALKFAYDPNVETIQYDLWIHKLSVYHSASKSKSQKSFFLNKIIFLVFF